VVCVTTTEVEAQIEKYRPKHPEDEAAGGTLWHLNRKGLLGQALAREAEKRGVDVNVLNAVLTKGTAWEVMAEAQRAGVVFDSK